MKKISKLKPPQVKIGTDICQINRIKSTYEKLGKKFLEKILTKNEIKYVTSNKKNFIHKLAGRFAAKEATLKVLGTGLDGVYFKEIEILRENSGSPKIVLHKRAKEVARKKRLSNFEVSISHEKDFAIAIVIGMRAPEY
ncbi:MAG: holo-ACP synthase [Candidatus Melainabacteria bacterium]|nr:holo-ACP synthase [Candidatus Melainabacteria bacterium]